ncbi:unnamed protein product [Chrysoparadoxa australica]
MHGTWELARPGCVPSDPFCCELGYVGSWPNYDVFNWLPWTEKLYFWDFEKNYDVIPMSHFLLAIPDSVPVLLCAIYVVLALGGRKFMESRKPFDLKYPLIAWNFLLFAFSAFGMLRMVPHVTMLIVNRGFKGFLTTRGGEQCAFGTCGLWVQLFLFSKVAEFIDTAFIVLRKKPLLFLHWYHHVTVMLFCWHAFRTESAAGLFFEAMNLCVHAVMYLYYGLAGFKIRLCQPRYVTYLQLSQMFIGIALCVTQWYYRLTLPEGTFFLSESNLWAGAAMYFSYACLFLQYFFRRFGTKPKKTAKAVEQRNGSEAVEAKKYA